MSKLKLYVIVIIIVVVIGFASSRVFRPRQENVQTPEHEVPEQETPELFYAGVLTEPSSFFIDNILIKCDDKIEFSENFDHQNISDMNWTIMRHAKQQCNFSHSPPNSLTTKYPGVEGTGVSCVFHNITIEQGWKKVNYTAWIMLLDNMDFSVQDLKGSKHTTHQSLVLYSGNTRSNIGGGIQIEYFPLKDVYGLPYVMLHINEERFGNWSSPESENSDARLKFGRWYKFSLILDRDSKLAQLYVDDKKAVELPLDVSLFETFEQFSVWGWIP